MLAIPRRRINIGWELIKISLNFIFFGKNYNGCRNKFEREFSDYLGVKFALGVSSARRALAISLTALGLSEDDEIILASLNYFAVPAVVEALGMKAVFVDVEEDTGNINPELIEEKITSQTKAIIVTHLFGRVCRIDKVVEISRRNNLFLIEDCAQSLGAEYKGRKVGSFGDIGIFSFSIGKAIICFGGGMLVTNNFNIFRKIKQEIKNSTFPKKSKLIKEIFKYYLASFFSKRPVFNLFAFPLLKLSYLVFGENIIDNLFGERPKPLAKEYLTRRESKLSDFQSAVGLLQLEKLERQIAARSKNSQMLYEALKDLNVNLRSASGKEHVHLNNKLIVPNRSSLRKKLLWRGIDTQRNDVQACHKLDFISKRGANCPFSEVLSEKIIGIPNYPGLKEGDVANICKEIKNSILV